MIKIISFPYHANIGDSRSSAFLAGMLKTWTGKDCEFADYTQTNFKTKEDVRSFCLDTEAIIIGAGGVFNTTLWNTDPGLWDHLTCPVYIWTSGFNFDDFNTRPKAWKESISALFSKVELAGFRTDGDVSLSLTYGISPEITYVCPDSLIMLGANIVPVELKKAGVIIPHSGDIDDFSINSCLESRGFDPKRIYHEQNYGNDFKFSDYFGLDIAVSWRFHGTLLAFAFGVPCFTIETNIRHRFIRQMIYPSEYWYYTNNTDEWFLLDAFIDNKEQIRLWTLRRREELKKMFISFMAKLAEKIMT